MTALPPDYDRDPERWLAVDRNAHSRIHALVAERVVAERLTPVADVGGGDGALAAQLPGGWPVVLLDASPTQLRRAPGMRVQADAAGLPLPDHRVGAVAMLWMLYHLEHPRDAIAEARRVLRPGGLFVAATSSRTNDPELTDGYPATTFDAEEAEGIVGSVFDSVRVTRWDRPAVCLADRAAVLRYCRSRGLPPETADRAAPPLWLTKRGCLVWARA
ncbi:MAG: class I SAM-dependent methyltransferase [Candidatus Dormibacteraeota bacterium]|nr:class I SAM-dependent methyltransferase [Candidatus Dormibacteraeota bacterium]